MPTLEEEQKRKELEDYLAMKFAPQGTSPFDVGLSKSTATVPVGVPSMPGADQFQLTSLEPKIDMMAMLQAKQPTVPPPQPFQQPSVSTKPGIPAMATDAAAAPPDAKPANMLSQELIDYQRKQDEELNKYDERIAASRREGPNWGQVMGMGFAGLGEAISGAPYLQNTLRQAETDYGKKEQWLTKEKAEFEERDTRNPDSFISQKYRELAARYTGQDPASLTGMSAYQIAKVLPTIKDLYTQELQAEQLRESRQFQKKQLELKGEELDIQRGAKASKMGEEARKTAVPGFINTGEVGVDEMEAKKLREGMAAWESFTSGIDRYKELVQKHGTGELMNQSAAGEMQQIATDLQLTVKKLAQLGVLSKSDEPFIKKQIPDPSFFQTSGKMLSTLDSSKKRFTEDLMNNMKARGYAPSPEMQKRIQGMGTQAPAQGDMITVTNGTETYQIPVADEAEAASEGFRRV